MQTHSHPDPFSARATLRVGERDLVIHRLDRAGLADLDRAPMTVKILLENVLRHAGGDVVTEDDVRTLAAWRPGGAGEAEVPFLPARVILQELDLHPAAKEAP